MLKNYEVSYRKRGLPSSDIKKMLVKAENFPGAMYLAGQEAGEEYVVLSAKQIYKKEEEKENDIFRVSESDRQSDPNPR